METVTCLNLQGEERVVNKNELILRPAVYALVINDKGELLVEDTRPITGKFWFLGGEQEKGEQPEITLAREVDEEAGLGVVIEELLETKSFYFYYDPTKKAYDCRALFYRCKLESNNTDRTGSVETVWLKIKELNKADFHPLVRDVIDKINL